MGKRFLVCLVCLDLTAALEAECLTSLPMPLLEECILTEAAGYTYNRDAHLNAPGSRPAPGPRVQPLDQAGLAGASTPDIAGTIP